MERSTTLLAHVDGLETARLAVDALIDAHVPPRDIAVLVRTDEGLEELETRYRNGAFVGLPGGAALGAVGAALGAGAVAGPLGAGTAVVVGSGAILGATAGGFAGLMVWDWVLTESEQDPDSVIVAVRNASFLDTSADVLSSLGAQTRRVREDPKEQLRSGAGHLSA